MKVPSFPDDVAMALIEEELGQPWHEVYSELSSSPIAAGRLDCSHVHILLDFDFFEEKMNNLI